MTAVESLSAPETSFTRDAERTLFWLRGEYDVSTVASLSEDLDRAIALTDADLLLDLSEVDFIDVATVRVVLRTREFLRLRSRSLALRSPSTCARRLLDLCGVADLLDLPSVGALASWVAVPAADRADRRGP